MGRGTVIADFFSALAFACLAVTGQDFVVLLLGQKWEPAGPLLCIFAVRGIAHTVERTLGWLHVSAGRSDRWTRWGFFSAVCQLVAVFAGIPFGLVGVATAHAIATFCLFVPALVYAGRPVGIGIKDVVRAVGPQTVAALTTVAIGFTVQRLYLNDYSQLTRSFFPQRSAWPYTSPSRRLFQGGRPTPPRVFPAA